MLLKTMLPKKESSSLEYKSGGRVGNKVTRPCGIYFMLSFRSLSFFDVPLAVPLLGGQIILLSS